MLLVTEQKQPGSPQHGKLTYPKIHVTQGRRGYVHESEHFSLYLTPLIELNG